MADLTKYIPPRLVIGTRWYIIYYQTNPATEKLERHRETHKINRIKSKRERRKKAVEIMNKISAELPFGYPYNQIEGSATLTLKLTPILQAVQFALELKLAELNRKNSHKGYKGKVNFFKSYLEKKKLLHIKVGEWSQVYTNDFINYLSLVKKPSPTTYNDYIRQMKGLFDILLDQHYVKINYFDGVKKRKEVPTVIRKRLTDDIRTAFVQEVTKVEDKWFLLAIVLQYYFFFRPVEISRLKVNAVDLKNWRVELPPSLHKTYKERYLKIPEVAKKYFPEEIDTLPKNWYLIGPGIKPSVKEVDKNGMYRRNLRYLKILKEKGYDIEGLTFYSWKNTGGFDMLNKNEKITVFDVQERMGHSDIKTTKRYITANDKNAEHIKNEL